MLGYFLNLFKSIFGYSDLILVTGANSSHFKSLIQFLESAERFEKKSKKIVFDLGLTSSENEMIKNSFSSIEVRKFNFNEFPSYFDIKVNAGEYAWKPVIVADVMNEFKSDICWMDSGNLITKPLLKIRSIIKEVGIYSPHSSGNLNDWTYPDVLNRFKVSEEMKTLTNLNGACIAISYANMKARSIIDQWKKYALIKACIAPEGSNRSNHRQDQSLFSILTYQAGLEKIIPSKYYGFKTHQDID